VTDEVPAPPDGFVRFEGRGEFQLHNGPWFHRASSADPLLIEHALYVLPRHTNGLGVLHGGMLSAFMDGLLGSAASRGAGRPGMTVHLSVDFLRMVRRGAWLMGEARMTHATQDLAFAEGRALVGGRPVGRASGVFKLMGRAPAARSAGAN
jgi:uncharacterized protein (TIGR00369 family)